MESDKCDMCGCLEAEIEKLNRVIIQQGKAIDFYGDENSWFTYCSSYGQSYENFTTEIDSDDLEYEKEDQIGGKLARQTKKQVEEILKGSE
jgi:hypothetical protein